MLGLGIVFDPQKDVGQLSDRAVPAADLVKGGGDLRPESPPGILHMSFPVERVIAQQISPVEGLNEIDQCGPLRQGEVLSRTAI